MTRHVVRLFARYAELFGNDQVDVMLPSSATVADVIAALRELPGGGSLPASPFVVVNMVKEQPAAPVKAGDEIALLPPLAGG
ncbi:MAG: MoaD/ThiS family protein [Gemmatimonadota bacterium]